MDLLRVSSSPHIKHEDSTRVMMTDVIIALLPALIWSVYVFGFRALTVTLLSVVFCVLLEGGYQLLMKKPVTISDMSAAVTGMLLAFCLPATIPMWMVMLGDFFAIILVKQLFGGIGRNIVNPAISARIFLFVSFPSAMSDFSKPFSYASPFAFVLSAEETDAIASATPLSQLKNGVLPSDAGIFDLFVGNVAGCIGEISAALLLVGGLYLMIRRVIAWQIPVAFILTVGAVSYFFPQTSFPLKFMVSELSSGCLILGAFFMATDYVTSPVTPNGRLIYGAMCGLLTIFIRYFGGYPEGVSFAILIMNLLVWYIDKFTRPVRFGGEPKKARESKKEKEKT